jgi:hypothetical protein
MLRDPAYGSPLEAEARFTQSVLADSMTYLDTSRFAAIRDKREWPDNWAKSCEPAAFMAEIVDGVPVEVKTQWRITKALEDSMAAMARQYGRKYALWVMWQRYSQGKAPSEAALQLLDQSVLRLREDDLEELLRLLPAESHDLVREEWGMWLSAAAENVEGEHRQTYDFGTHGV